MISLPPDELLPLLRGQMLLEALGNNPGRILCSSFPNPTLPSSSLSPPDQEPKGLIQSVRLSFYNTRRDLDDLGRILVSWLTNYITLDP